MTTRRSIAARESEPRRQALLWQQSSRTPRGAPPAKAAFRAGRGSMNDLHLAPQTFERRALLRALRALKRGDFAVRMPLDMSDGDGELAQAFNDVAEMNQSIADELARICRDVGRQGQINQRMRVAAAAASWASQVDSVNEQKSTRLNSSHRCIS